MSKMDRLLEEDAEEYLQSACWKYDVVFTRRDDRGCWHVWWGVDYQEGDTDEHPTRLAALQQAVGQIEKWRE